MAPAFQTTPFVGRDADGRLEIFVVGTDQALYDKWQTIVNGGWSDGWANFGGAFLGNLAIGQNADGRLEIFGVGSDHALYHRWQTAPNSGWSDGWVNFGGSWLGDPTVVQNADGRLEIFGVGSDHALYHRWQTAPNNGWSNEFAIATIPAKLGNGWTNFGGSWLGDPTVVQNADGRLEVFGVGSDHALYHRWQTAPNSNWSDGWMSLGGSIFVGKPAVGRNADGRLEILVLGSDHTLYHNWQTAPNGSWSNVWYNEGGSWLGDPAVGQNADGRLQIVVVGADHALYTKWQGTTHTQQVPAHSVESSHDILQPDSVPHGIKTGIEQPPPGWTAGWNNFGGSFVGKPAVVQRADGRLQIFVVGTDHALYTKMQTAPNNVWFGGWADISLPPMDLLWDSTDDNGLPLNPRWRYQMITGLPPDPPTLCSSLAVCTSQPTAIDASAVCDILQPHWIVPGHWNWFPVTLEGPISWESHSEPGTDDDYNIKFFSPDNAGYTVSTVREGYIELEFDSDETIDYFSTPWWQSFHDAVDNSDSAASVLKNIKGSLLDTPAEEQLLEQAIEQVHQVLKDGSYAIVTGLFGLDCAHDITDAHAELHPVYAIAILVEDNPADQLWAIFVRNWGDEGFCSQSQHYLDRQAYSFRLPWKLGTTTTPVISHQFLTNNSDVTGPDIQFALNEGVLVTFILPPPEAGARLHGELHLQWQ